MINKLFILFLMFFMSMSLHANYSPALDWSFGDLSTSEINYSLISVSDELKKAENLRVAAILINVFLGLGIGSFVQGDIKSGTVLFAYDLLGNGLLVVGYALILTELIPLGALGVLLGSGLHIASFVRGLVAPSRYVNSLKKDLKTTYNFRKYNNNKIDKNISYNFTLANF